MFLSETLLISLLVLFELFVSTFIIQDQTLDLEFFLHLFGEEGADTLTDSFRVVIEFSGILAA